MGSNVPDRYAMSEELNEVVNRTGGHQRRGDIGMTTPKRTIPKRTTMDGNTAAAHVAYFLPASIRALDEWRAGALWTLERDVKMTGVDAAFWALPGGFALPLGLLGLLVRRHARQGTPPPAWLGCGVGAWALIGSLISEPSGFPVGLVPAGMLVAASRRARRAANGTGNTPRG